MLSDSGNITSAVSESSSSASVLALLLGSAAVALPSNEHDVPSLIGAALPSPPAAARSVLALSLALVLLAALLALCDCLFGSVRAVRYYLSTAGQSSYLRRSLFSGWRPLYSLLATVALSAQGASLLCVLSSSTLLFDGQRAELLDALTFAASVLAALLLCLTVVRRGTASTSALWNALQRPLLYAAAFVSATGGLALLGFAFAAKQRSVSALLPRLAALVAAAPQPCAADDASCGAAALGAALKSIAAASWGLNAMRAAMLFLLAAIMLATSLTAQGECSAAARLAESEATQQHQQQPEEERPASSGFRIFHREPRRAKLQEVDEHALRRGSGVPEAIDEWGASVHMLDYAGSWHADHLSSYHVDSLSPKQRHERRGSAISAFSSVQGLKLDESDEMGASLVRKYGSAEDYGSSVPVAAYYNQHHRVSEAPRRGSSATAASRAGRSDSRCSKSSSAASRRSKKQSGALAGVPLVDASEAAREVAAPAESGTAAQLRAERRRLRLDLLFGLSIVGLLALLLALRFAAGDALALGMRPQLRLVDEAAQALLLGAAHAAALVGLIMRGSGGWAREALPEVQGAEEGCAEKRWRTRQPWDRA